MLVQVSLPSTGTTGSVRNSGSASTAILGQLFN